MSCSSYLCVLVLFADTRRWGNLPELSSHEFICAFSKTFVDICVLCPVNKPPFSAAVENEQDCIFLLSICFPDVKRDNFAFTFYL